MIRRLACLVAVVHHIVLHIIGYARVKWGLAIELFDFPGIPAGPARRLGLLPPAGSDLHLPVCAYHGFVRLDQQPAPILYEEAAR